MKRFIFSHLFLLFLLFFSFVPEIRAQSPKEENASGKIATPVVVFAKIDKVEATVGDILTYTLNIDREKAVKITIPEFAFSGFTVISRENSPEKILADRVLQTINVKLQVNEPGNFIIEPFTFNYFSVKESGVVKTSKIYLQINSILKPGEELNDLEDLKDPEAISVFSFSDFLLTSFFLMTLVFLIIFFSKIVIRWRTKKLILAHEIAFAELEKIKNEQLIEKGLSKEFFFRTSNLLRAFIAVRFSFPARELPPEELQERICLISELEPAKEFLLPFFEQADFYKYSNIDFSGDFWGIFSGVYAFIEKNKELPKNEVKNVK